MSAILNSLNAHNLAISQPILMILVSKFMVHRVLSDETYLSLGLLSPLNPFLDQWNFQYSSGWSIVYIEDSQGIIMQHFIWVYNVCKSTRFGFSGTQTVPTDMRGSGSHCHAQIQRGQGLMVPPPWKIASSIGSISYFILAPKRMSTLSR